MTLPPTATFFEYCYRDASNYKSWERLLLRGCASDADIRNLMGHLHDGEFFIAEQLRIPSLYAELWALSGGPTDADHVWHAFHALTPAKAHEINLPVFATVESLIASFQAVSVWHEHLSPHWGL